MREENHTFAGEACPDRLQHTSWIKAINFKENGIQLERFRDPSAVLVDVSDCPDCDLQAVQIEPCRGSFSFFFFFSVKQALSTTYS